MYSKKVIARVIKDFSDRQGFHPQFRSVSEVDELVGYIDSLVDVDANSMNRYYSWRPGKRPSDKRIEWINQQIESEQFLCFASAEYFVTRYCKIRDVQERIINFDYRKAQEIFNMILAEYDDRQIAIQLFILKCMDPSTKVLNADLKWVSLEEVKVGDELVAIDEGETLEQLKKRRAEKWKKQSRGENTSRARSEWLTERRMRTCKVEAKWDTFGRALRLKLDDGRTLVASPEHRFLSKQRGGVNSQWRATGDFRIGDEIRWITKPWGESAYEDGWMGGVIDGEGTIRAKNRAGAEGTITQCFNGVYSRAVNYLKERGYKFTERVDRRPPGPKSKFSKQDIGRIGIGRMDELFRLTGQTRPIRFIKERWWEGKSLPGRNSGVGWAKIVNIEEVPEQRLIDIQTSTGTFIAEGIVSHNCRQVGISTVVALYFLHRILFRTNTHAIMASAQVQQSEKLAMMIETAWSRLPFWLPPAKTTIKEKEPRWANGSALSVQAGSQNVGIAQGSTPTCLHISEIADYATPKKTIEEGLFPAAHQTSALFFVMEGTGSTASPWQQEKWLYYKEHWGKGGRFRTLFIPPACADDIYPHADWLRANPIRESWHPREETLRMKRRCELFVRSTDYLAANLGANWEMARNYMWYWECGYMEAVASHSVKTYLSQNSVTDLDAFQSKFDPVFADETIEVVTKEREQKYTAYAVTGRTILMGSDNHPYIPPSDEVDWNGERIPLKWESNDGNVYKWELVPLLPFDDSDDVNCFDKLLVFQEPRLGANYAEAIDTADGLNMPNEDRSALSMHIGRTGKERDEQTCSFTSIRVNAAQIARIAAAVAVYYCTDGNGQITSDNPLGPKFIIEQTRKAGDDCQLALKIMGFYDHHVMIRYDDKGGIVEGKGHKEGFFTSRWSRPLLLNKFVNAVTTGWFKPNDPILIRQLKTFIRKERFGISEMGHESGQHDDNVFAAALGWFRLHHLDSESVRLQEKYKPKEILNHEIDNRWATNAIQID